MRFSLPFTRKQETSAQTTPDARAECQHYNLVPQWDTVADMGKEEKVTAYRCSTCGKQFAPQDAQTLRR